MFEILIKNRSSRSKKNRRVNSCLERRDVGRKDRYLNKVNKFREW